MSKRLVLSVIIPCLNEVGTVERLLEQCIEQNTSEVEVIAVDNKSDDNTLQILSGFKTQGIQVVSDIERGVSRARNAGAAQAQGEWLLFLDADTVLPAHFLRDLTKLLLNQPKFRLAAVSYRATSKSLLFRLLTWCAIMYQRVSFLLFRRPLIPGAVCLVKRSVHEEIGGFNESILYNEDFDYSTRAYKVAESFKTIRRPFVYFSTRRLENGGWHKVIATYIQAEFARLRGKRYDPENYDMSDHSMK